MEILPIFKFLESKGGVSHREMFNIFNMGVGMVIAVDAADAAKTIEILEQMGERASVIGTITDKAGAVEII